MKLNERNNYIIALMFSLGFHALLLLLFVSGYLASKPAHLETFPVGMVEIAKGSPDGEVGMMVPLPENPGSEQAKIPAVPNPPAQKNQEKEKNAVKPQVSLKTSPEPAIVIPKKDKNEPAAVPSKNSSPTGPVGSGNSDIGGNGKGGTGKPFGFGSGEGMVTVLGPVPTYPKNASNEGKEGDVPLRILVRADGSLEDIKVNTLSVDSRLINAAVSSIRRNWKFKPVSQNYYIDLIFYFRIDPEVVKIKFVNAESSP